MWHFKDNIQNTSLKSTIIYINKICNFIEESCQKICDDANSEKKIEPEFRKLFDSYFLIDNEINYIRQNLKTLKHLHIPSHFAFEVIKFPRIFFLVNMFLVENNCKIKEQDLIQFIENCQKQHQLIGTEIELLEIMLKCALIFRLAIICDKKINKIKNKTTLKVTFPKLDSECKKKFSINNASYDDIPSIIKSFNSIVTLDFQNIFQKISIIEKILTKDPAGIYTKMTEASKKYYRNIIKKIAKKRNFTEIEVAQKAIEFASEYNGSNSKKKHIGYYFINEPKMYGVKNINFLKTIYIPIIRMLYFVTFLFVVYILYFFIRSYNEPVYSSFYSFLLECLAVYYLVISILMSDVIINLINLIASIVSLKSTIPRIKIDQIPFDAKTLVVITSVVVDEDAINELIRKLEIYKNANLDKHLSFGILIDPKDSKKETDIADKKLFKLAKEKINDLNNKYKETDFYLFQRKKIYDKKEKAWIAPEKKRGAFYDLNAYILRGEDKNFLGIVGSAKKIKETKYIITLDSDTRLLRESARALVSAMIHPLNKPEISKKGIVESGYTIMQPQMLTDIRTSKTQFSKIYRGRSGIDSYAASNFDIYQDLFGEGSFVGKGIYEIETFDKILSNKFPNNTVLSHDLLESCHVRCAFISDVFMVDDFPPCYISYMQRQERWIRGDYQTLPWIFKKVKTKNGKEKNKIKQLSKIKILDNLRRPLVPITALIASLFSIGSNKKFIVFLIFYFFYPFIISVIFDIKEFFSKFSRFIKKRDIGIFGRTKFFSNIIYGTRLAFYNNLTRLACLPTDAYRSIKAIITAFFRMFISKKKRLFWSTSRECNGRFSIFCHYKYMFSNLICGAVGFCFRYHHLPFPLILILLWLLAPLLMYILSQTKEKKARVPSEDKEFLIDVARQIWKFYEKYADADNNFLPPDNVQIDPPVGVAHRTSTTNIGMLLASYLVARDFEFINTREMIDKFKHTFKVIDELEKWNGQLYNWYQTQSLEALKPRFVSSVDNGNLIALSFMIKEGIKEYQNDNGGKYEREIKQLVDKFKDMITNTKFYIFFDKKRQLFSLGYEKEKENMLDIWYDLLMSESRQTGYVAISTGEVGIDHWRHLSRNQKIVGPYKAVISWTGTMFEYLMPLLLMPSYDGTLLSETYKICIHAQIERAKKLRIPWGVSESQYYDFFVSQDYKYAPFGVSELSIDKSLTDQKVVAPYASFLALGVAPIMAIENLKKLKKLGAMGKYGFYEAIDFTENRTKSEKGYEIIKTFMSHHVGMSLLSICNFLKDNIIQKRFMKDVRIAASSELLEEALLVNLDLENGIGHQKRFKLEFK